MLVVRCNFSRLFFIPINVGILKQRKGTNNNKISLRDGFDDLQKACKNIKTDKQIICKVCNKVSEYQETKSFYRTAKNLIIIFDRGENFENRTYIDFDENLTLNNLAQNINKINYQLIGIVEKLKDEYISFTKAGNIWISSYKSQISFNDAKKFGTVVALFYYSDDNNLSIENKEDINLSSITLDEQVFVSPSNFTISSNNSLINGNNINFDLNRRDNNMQQFSGFGNVSNINSNPNNSMFSDISKIMNIDNNNINNINNPQIREQTFTDNQLSGFLGNPQTNNIYNNINQNNNNNNQNGPYNQNNSNNINNNYNINNNQNNNFGFGGKIEWL